MKPDNYSSELTNSVRVTKTLETLPRGWISLSEDELIEAYNYAPRVLSRKAIKVSKIDLGEGDILIQKFCSVKSEMGIIG